MAGFTVYSVLYAFEYFTYTNAVKEERFKAQFSNHAKQQLKALALENTSQNSFAMNRELDRSFTALMEKVNQYRGELEAGIAHVQSDLAKLEERVSEAEGLRLRASTSAMDLEAFTSRF